MDHAKPATVAYRARYVFPITQPPIPNGVVTIQAGIIRQVGIRSSVAEEIDLGNVALLPGLINAHTHLEFSDLVSPLPRPDGTFASWIRSLIARRREADLMPMAHRISRGIQETLAAGVVGVGDIFTGDTAAMSAYDSAVPSLHVVGFRELLGLAPDRQAALMESADAHLGLRANLEARERWRVGVSPHAPYTVGPNLVEWAAGRSAQHQCPIAMHLAETSEELELLADHSGPLVELLREVNAWHPEAIPRGTRIQDYLERLSMGHRALVIHGNFLDTEQQEFLAQRADVLSVVYCPRTHAYFDHPSYPLAEMLQRGVRVAMGTDSRASNPDLDVFEDLRWVAARYPQVEPSQLLGCVTAAAADALGLGNFLGRLMPNSLGSMLAVGLPKHDAADPHELLWESSTRRVIG